MRIKLAIILILVVLIPSLILCFFKHPKKYNYSYRNKTNLFINQIEIERRRKYHQTISNNLLIDAIYTAKKRSDFITNNLIADILCSVAISILILLFFMFLRVTFIKLPTFNLEALLYLILLLTFSVFIYFLKWYTQYKKYEISEEVFYNKLHIILSKLKINNATEAQKVIDALNEELKTNEVTINTGFQVLLTVVILTPIVTHLSLLWKFFQEIAKYLVNPTNSLLSVYIVLFYLLLFVYFLLSAAWGKLRYSNFILLLPTQRRSKRIEQTILILERYIYLNSSNQI